jgi:N-acyl-D-amino-acid deacylase
MNAALIVGFVAVLLLQLPAFAESPVPFELILQGGSIVDGTGNPWYRADIGIRDGLIVEIGDLSGRATRRSLPLQGKVVAPGFIDMLVGSSLPLWLDPRNAESELLQGVTTIVVGEGDSMAPQNERTLGDFPPSDNLPVWHRYSEYFTLLEKTGIALNVVHNVGATQVRRIVIGEENQPPKPEQLSRMKDLVADAMRDGAVGLSTALIYPPGIYAKPDEIIELAKVAAQFNGVYFTHIRNESGQLLDGIREAIRVGDQAHIPVHIYHLKAAGEENWSLMPKALQLIQEARDRGLDITADIYPYVRNGIGLDSFIHPRHFAGDREAFLRSLSDSRVRTLLRREIETTSDWENWYLHVGKNWDNVLVAKVGQGIDRHYEGKSIQQIALARHEDSWKVFFDLVPQGDIDVNPKSMNEDQKRQALQAGFVCIGSDSAPSNAATTTNAHPRAFGTFPRVIAKYVREEKVIRLEEAIRLMTSLPANILRLPNRGRISTGMAADLVILDPASVRDTATFEHPVTYPVGIEFVLVNGAMAVENGKMKDSRSGRIIRHIR